MPKGVKKVIVIQEGGRPSVPVSIDLSQIPDEVTHLEFVNKLTSLNYKEMMACGLFLDVTPKMIRSIIDFK